MLHAFEPECGNRHRQNARAGPVVFTRIAGGNILLPRIIAPAPHAATGARLLQSRLFSEGLAPYGADAVGEHLD